MKKNKKAVIALSVLGAAAVLITGASLIIGNETVKASVNLCTNEQTKELYEGSWEHEGFSFTDFQEKYNIEHKTMVSSAPDGHTLPFDIITKEGNKNVVIMAHGMLGCSLTNFPTAEIFLEQGYNVISYDQRSSGDNYAELSTYGYLEKYDLISCINYAEKIFPDEKIVVWGESFGGATAILAVGTAGINEKVSALILDCPVSSMSGIIESELKKMGMPMTSYIMKCADFMNRMKMDFSFSDADGRKYAEKITVPTLIFNTKADEITPVFMGQEIYDSLASERKEIFTAENSAHIEIRLDEKEVYKEKISEFLP